MEALNNLQGPNKHPNAQAIPIVADVSSAADLERAAAEVSKTTDHVDILLANAGATFIGQLEDYKEEDFANVMNVNVNSVFFTIQKSVSLSEYENVSTLTKCRFIPHLEAGGTVADPSRVIMVSSVAGVVIGDVGPYGSKILQCAFISANCTDRCNSICICRVKGCCRPFDEEPGRRAGPPSHHRQLCGSGYYT